MSHLGIVKLLHGLTINVSNYQELGIMLPEVASYNISANCEHTCCQVGSWRLTAESAGLPTLSFATALHLAMETKIGSFTPRSTHREMGLVTLVAEGGWVLIQYPVQHV